MIQEYIFKDVFIREINKAKEHLGSLGADTVTLKYTFTDKQDKDLVNELSFKIRPRNDNEQ